MNFVETYRTEYANVKQVNVNDKFTEAAARNLAM